MTEILKFIVLGLGVGGIYAIAAQGLVLTYRGSGVLNLAHGAMALLGAAIYKELRDGGQPTVVTMVVPAMVTALVGVAIHIGVMRPLRTASPLARLVVTLGVLGVVQSSALLRYGTEFDFVPSILPTDTWHAGDVVIGADRAYLFAIAVVVTVALWCTYRFTSFGRSTNAVAENQRAASALGISPDVVASANWALGGAMAGFAGILISPITGFAPGTLSMLIVPVLAAAMVGAFTSFPLTLLGGLAIGVAQSLMGRYVDATGWSSSAPFLLIIVLLVVRGRAIPLRGFLADKLPRVGRSEVSPLVVAVGVGLGLLLIFTLPLNGVDSMTTTLTVGIIALSVVVVTGLAGQVSLGQYAFAGMGAFVSSRLAQTQGLPFLAALVIGVAASVLLGLVFGLPALRMRGVNLAIVTLGLALALQQIVLSNVDYTGGFSGTVVDPPSLFGLSLDSTTHPERFAVLCLVLFTILALMVANLRRGRAGRRLLAVRGNERAASSLGISTIGAKLYAFALAGGIAAVAGVLQAFRYTNVNFAGYEVFASMNIVVLTFLGGVGYVSGALLAGGVAAGGAITQAIQVVINFEKYATLATSVMLIAVVVVDPNGTADRLARIGRRLVHRVPKPPLPGRFARLGPAAIAVPLDEAEEDVRCARKELVVEGLSVRFGGVVALDGVSVRVQPGQIVGLIGPNGAGKTTFIDTVTGFSKAHAGRVQLDDRDLRALAPRSRAALGLGRSFQNLELFEDLTVADNLRAACDSRDPLAYVTDLVAPRRTELTSAARRAVQDFELVDDLDRLPSELSYGKRRLVAIARAVARRPSVLLLDEPAAGLDEHETTELGMLLRRIAEEWGMGILLVEHDMALVMDVCDRITVLNFGTLLAEGTAESIREHEQVRAAYLGSSITDEPASATADKQSQKSDALEATS